VVFNIQTKKPKCKISPTSRSPTHSSDSFSNQHSSGFVETRTGRPDRFSCVDTIPKSQFAPVDCQKKKSHLRTLAVVDQTKNLSYQTLKFKPHHRSEDQLGTTSSPLRKRTRPASHGDSEPTSFLNSSFHNLISLQSRIVCRDLIWP